MCNDEHFCNANSQFDLFSFSPSFSVQKPSPTSVGDQHIPPHPSQHLYQAGQTTGGCSRYPLFRTQFYKISLVLITPKKGLKILQ